MNPELDDPNNHVPPVTPDDDWGDLDGEAEVLAAGLPPIRSDRSIPSKKQGIAPRAGRQMPRLKLHEDTEVTALEKQANVEKIDADAERSALNNSDKPARKNPKKPPRKGVQNLSKQQARKTAKKSTAKTDEDLIERPAVKEPGAGVEEPVSDAPVKTILPPSYGNKRIRIHEIGASREVDPERIPRMYPKGTAETEERAIQKAARPRKRFSRGESAGWGEKGASGSLRWMLYTGAGVVVLIVAAVILSDPTGGVKSREKSMFSQLAPEKSEAESQEVETAMMAMLTAGQDDAKRIFAQYATAESIDDFIGVTYRADQVAPLLEKNWTPLRAKSGWQPGDEAVWTLIEDEDLRHGTLSGSLPDFTSYRAFFRWEEGVLKMDWKATVGYGSADFSDLKMGRGDGSEVRGLLSPADFHTFPLPEGEFRSFRLASPDGSVSIWGYTRVGGEIDAKLIALFMPSQITGETRAEVAVIVGLERGPEESLPSQWMITSLPRFSWLDE